MQQYFEFVERHFITLLALHLSVFAIVILGSVIYRIARGKPVLGWTIDEARYLERFASGHSHRAWYTKLGGASRCLLVGVAKGRLVVRPWFPFNLMFLPEVYGLEYDVAIENVEDVEVSSGLFGRSIRLRLRAEGSEAQDVTLYLRDPDRLVEALRASEGS